MKLPNFKILTEKSTLDIPYENDEQNEKELVALWRKQDSILLEKGFDFEKKYAIHFFDSKFMDENTMETEIHEGLEYLAIKDGADLVQYDNGNYGFVAYENGVENGFEILNIESER